VWEVRGVSTAHLLQVSHTLDAGPFVNLASNAAALQLEDSMGSQAWAAGVQFI
jgi:hypothetical protein